MVNQALDVSNQNSEFNEEYSEALKKSPDILDLQNAKLRLQANEAEKSNDLDERRRVLIEMKKVETLMLKLLRNGYEAEGSGSGLALDETLTANNGNSSPLINDGLQAIKSKNIEANDDMFFDRAQIGNEFVWPLTGIVVNLPTRIVDISQYFGASKPACVNYMWDRSGFIAVVEFERGLTGFRDAMLFERAYEEDNHGKKDWLRVDSGNNNDTKIGLFGWIARAEDFNSDEGIIGAYLRSNGVVKDFMGLCFEEEFGNKDDKVLEITNRIEDKTKDLKRTALELSNGILSLCDLVEEKAKILKTQHQDVKKVRLSARGYFKSCLKEQEKLKLKLESKTKEVEFYKTEFEKQEMRYKSEKKCLVDQFRKMEAINIRQVGELELQMQTLIVNNQNANLEAMESDEFRRIQMENFDDEQEYEQEQG